MKLLRYGPIGKEKPACLDSENKIRDLSGVMADIQAQHAFGEELSKLNNIDVGKLPLVNEDVRLGTPYSNVGKFICVGLNYKDHADETGSEIPAEPVLFNKWSRPSGPNDPIVLPKGSVKADWEAELGVVIGKKASYVGLEDALKYVAGYCVVNDVSEREYQLERGGTWDKGKGCDTFGPIGPWLVTADEISDPQELSIWLEVNNKRYQSSNTKNMIFSVAYLIHYVSQFTTLFPGDIISTGTPHGVGLGQKPPVFLKDGDEIRLGIKGLGEQRQKVHLWSPELIDD